MAVSAGPSARRLRPAALASALAPSAWWLLPLLALHVLVCLASQPGPRPVNDEVALLAAAERLLDGGYAVRGTTDDVSWLWHGPGVPALLVPLLALGLPLEVTRIVAGPLLLFGAVLVAHRALLRMVAPRVALGGALALGLFAPAMQPLRTVHKEPLAMLLVAAAMLFVVRALQATRWSWRDVAGAGLALGALVMVRVEYGWVLLALLLVAAGLARRPSARRCAAVLGAGLACCLPWLAYTADVSGRFPYWGNSGGESLFWMSPTGIPGQTGEFNGARTVFERPSLAPARPLFARLDRLAPLERDLELQRVAAANVRARPGGWARNLAANAVRLWFLVPTRPAPPTGAVAMYILFDTALLLACGWATVALWRRRRSLPAAVVPLAAFAFAGLAIHLLPSADPRMTLPLVPVLIALVAVARAAGRQAQNPAPDGPCWSTTLIA
jgi:hypothetical protein